MSKLSVLDVFGIVSDFMPASSYLTKTGLSSLPVSFVNTAK